MGWGGEGGQGVGDGMKEDVVGVGVGWVVRELMTV